jgi:hypothetical protein
MVPTMSKKAHFHYMFLSVSLDDPGGVLYFFVSSSAGGATSVNAAGSRPAANPRATSIRLVINISREKQMARKYEYSRVPGRYFWNLEQCEEEIFIALYVEISDVIPRDQEWERRLERFFFDSGKGLGFEELNQLNAVLKFRALEPIEFRETEIDDYARSRDEQMKSQHRKLLREEFAKASPEYLAERLAQAKAEEKRLLPAHFTYEEFKLRKLQQNTVPPLGQGGVPRTVSAWLQRDYPEVIPISTNLPPRSKKHENFQRLLPKRKANYVKAVDGIKNLSSQNYYDYEEVDIEKLFDALRERLDEAHDAFRRRLTKQSRLIR